MGKLSREKGKRGERQTAREIREAIPWLATTVKRGWQARSGADDPDVVGLEGFWIEVKKGKNISFTNAIKQADLARKTSGNKEVPVAVVREDRKEVLMLMYWSDYEAILKEVGEYEKAKEREGYYFHHIWTRYPKFRSSLAVADTQRREDQIPVTIITLQTKENPQECVLCLSKWVDGLQLIRKVLEKRREEKQTITS